MGGEEATGQELQQRDPFHSKSEFSAAEFCRGQGGKNESKPAKDKLSDDSSPWCLGNTSKGWSCSMLSPPEETLQRAECSMQPFLEEEARGLRLES